jgi:quercetin dioxygenase-like cupin family protein
LRRTDAPATPHGVRAVVDPLIPGKPCEHTGVLEEGTTRTRLDPDVGERFLPLRRRLGVSSFGMNQIVLEPGQRGRIHRHTNQEEVYLVLEGILTLYVEGEPTDLGRGELIRVAPEVRRQLVNRGPGRVVLVALGGALEHQGRDGEAFGDWSDEAPVPPQELTMPPDLEPGELRH